jgi:hypothetical protein
MAGESADEIARRRRDKAAQLTRQAELYEVGAAGERLTAQVLASLPRGDWFAFHDLQWPGRRFANIDHIVVGPGGIFVIDSKNWTGIVEIKHGVLRQNGRSREMTVAATAESALAIARLLPSRWIGLVHPVICFAGWSGPSGRARDVLVCTTETLPQMLSTRPACLSQDSVRDVATQLEGLLKRHDMTTDAAGPVKSGRPRCDAGSATGKPSTRKQAADPRSSRERRSQAARPLSQLMRLLLVMACMYAAVRFSSQLTAAVVELVNG